MGLSRQLFQGLFGVLQSLALGAESRITQTRTTGFGTPRPLAKAPSTFTSVISQGAAAVATVSHRAGIPTLARFAIAPRTAPGLWHRFLHARAIVTPNRHQFAHRRGRSHHRARLGHRFYRVRSRPGRRFGRHGGRLIGSTRRSRGFGGG